MKEEKMPKVGVGVIVLKDGKTIMQKRKGSHGEGTWSFPGGHLEYKESVFDCAKRECYEELGIKIKDLKLGPYTNDVFKIENRHYITLFVIANLDEGSPYIKEKDRTSEIGWFNWNNLPSPLFLPIKNLINSGYALKI